MVRFDLVNPEIPGSNPYSLFDCRQLKKREQTLIGDYGELEDENITLQKQVEN